MLHGRLSNPWLTVVFGLLLLFVAVSELTGLAKRLRFHGPVAWIAGALSACWADWSAIRAGFGRPRSSA